MSYAVKEVFYTLQGEGYHSGRPAVFIRFSGCNLWSGREEDRSTAVCRFCDTDFFGTDGEGGGRFATAEALASHASRLWTGSSGNGQLHASTSETKKFAVCTGGEPLLQLDPALVDALHGEGFEIAVETNGTLAPPDGLDWICVSPKADADLLLKCGDELKLVYPQHNADPNTFVDLAFTHFYLQPMDGDDVAANTRAAIEYCLQYPRWKLSLQTQKLLGIP